jgi:hypothetical protein
MNAYNVLILIPESGNRILLDTVYVEVDLKHDTMDVGGHKITRSSWMDITIKIYNQDMSIYEIIKNQLFGGQFYLYFQDAHPNLIRTVLMDMQVMHDEIKLEMRGNATDKTYYDFLEEVTAQLNETYQHHFKSNVSNPAYIPLEPEPEPKSKFKYPSSKRKEKVIESKVTVLKRKLSF